MVRIAKLIRPNLSDLTVLITLAELDKTAAPAHHIVTVRNVSDVQGQLMLTLMNKNAALERSNDELSLLSHSLIHDLKEPIYTVRIRSELTAGQSTSLDQTQQEHLHGIVETCNRMDEFLNKLGLYAGAMVRGDPSIPPIDANIPYRDAVANLQGSITASHANIQCNNLPLVLVDPTALVLIFQNLLSNAIKYSAPGTPQITVSAVRQENFWQFTVSDLGSGFPPPLAEKIFELSNRAHGVEYLGNGIGLPICRMLIHNHGGKVWAESSPGPGARFHFTLPAASEQIRSVAV
jgi:light-regulated signal transduction histidine kinase (bacteriophytochrome)